MVVPSGKRETSPCHDKTSPTFATPPSPVRRTAALPAAPLPAAPLPTAALPTAALPAAPPVRNAAVWLPLPFVEASGQCHPIAARALSCRTAVGGRRPVRSRRWAQPQYCRTALTAASKSLWDRRPMTHEVIAAAHCARPFDIRRRHDGTGREDARCRPGAGNPSKSGHLPK